MVQNLQKVFSCLYLVSVFRRYRRRYHHHIYTRTKKTQVEIGTKQNPNRPQIKSHILFYSIQLKINGKMWRVWQNSTNDTDLSLRLRATANRIVVVLSFKR